MAFENMRLKSYQTTIYIILGFFVFIGLGFGYIRTEINTQTSPIELTGGRFCNNSEVNSNQEDVLQENTQLKYTKVIEYNNLKGTARIFCIYQDSSLNQELQLNRNNENWKVLYQQKLNQDGRLYFPIYF